MSIPTEQKLPISSEESGLANFADFNLDPKILKAVAEQGYTQATPIQAKAIPIVLEGRDVMGAAQTGTGKLPHLHYQLFKNYYPALMLALHLLATLFAP